MERISNISRETKETRIQAALWLSGGPVKIDTGIGFFDHMLHAWTTIRCSKKDFTTTRAMTLPANWYRC